MKKIDKTLKEVRTWKRRVAAKVSRMTPKQRVAYFNAATGLRAPAKRRRVAAPSPCPGRRSEPEREQCADRRDRVDRPRVEVALVDHAREADRRAENRGERRDGDGDSRAKACGRDPREWHGHERDRKAYEDESARGSALETASARVVERPGRKPRVGDKNRDGVECEEAPDSDRFHKPGPAPLLHFAASLD